uniref:Uncharacterized protein n=1 Tax=Tetranychus urticae TaxID=32264 RepID=T1JXR5_TETUR
MLPRFVIGLLNHRGHCYLIAALVPLLHSFPFLEFLLKDHEKFLLQYLAGRLTGNNLIMDRGDAGIEFNPECFQEVPTKWVLNGLLYDELVDALCLYCNPNYDNFKNGGDEKNSYSLFVNASRILAFAVDFKENAELSLLTELMLDVSGFVHSYVHFSSTVCFTCYKSSAGLDYGGFYHPFQDDDKAGEEHTYVHMRMNDDFYDYSGRYSEVKEGDVYIQVQDFGNYKPSGGF